MKKRKLLIAIAIIILVLLTVLGYILISNIDGDSLKDGITPNQKSVNILLIGGDDASKNTDTIMVVNYDPKDSTFNILSIPRDTRVQIKDRDRKINFAYPSGGIETLKSTILNLTGLKVDKYIFFDTSAFRDVIDILGGVVYTVPVDMKYDDDAQGLHIDLKAGEQLLDGDKAEEFIRFRHPNTYDGLPKDYVNYYNGSDIQRIKAQQDFFKELLKQKAKLSNIPKLSKILDVAYEKIKTDLTLNEMLSYVYSFDEISQENISTFVLSGEEKTINGVWYYDFTGNIKTKDGNVPISEAIKDYFTSEY